MSEDKKPSPPAPLPRGERGAERGDGGGVTATTKASAALGVLAAFGLAILVNVIVARSYKRWDWTSSHLYTLSEPTKKTLHDLQEPVQINVLLSSSDPLETSVRHLLDAYGAETDKLEIRYLDPDRRPAEFFAFQQKYGLGAGRTEDGRVVADAAIVAVKGDKKWVLTSNDLVDFSEADEGRARPKLEQGITIAIRNVLGGERTRVCFTKGHGELGADEPGARGLGELKYRLDRNNVDVQIVELGATLDPKKKPPLEGCSLAIVAGPQTPFVEAESRQLGDYLQKGGALFLLVNPLADMDKKRIVPSGLEPVAALGGIEMRNDLVFEKDAAWTVPESYGQIFFGQPKPSAITEALVRAEGKAGKLIFQLAQSLGRVPSAGVPPIELIATSKDAFGMTDFFAWADSPAPPEKHAGDHEGPLVLAMAAELPKQGGGVHGPRMVVVGSASIIQGQVWQVPQLRASAFFVDSAIAWLTAKPEIVDVPAKPAVMAGLRLTQESVSQVSAYVTLYIPLAAGLVATSVFLRRRSTEKRREPKKERS